jgi:signal transduction histidine kinase
VADRAGIARQIHDDVGQLLAALKLDLEGLGAAVRRGEPHAALGDRITVLVGQIDRGLADTMELIRELRSPSTGASQLASAIDAQVKRFQFRTGISCRTSGLEHAAALDGERAEAVFRIVDEALSNVARHAGADLVVIAAESLHGYFQLTVTDDGVGIPSDRMADASSFGLIGMRERAAAVQGRIEMAGAKPHGTVVRVILPLKGSM